MCMGFPELLSLGTKLFSIGGYVSQVFKNAFIIKYGLIVGFIIFYMYIMHLDRITPPHPLLVPPLLLIPFLFLTSPLLLSLASFGVGGCGSMGFIWALYRSAVPYQWLQHKRKSLSFLINHDNKSLEGSGGRRTWAPPFSVTGCSWGPISWHSYSGDHRFCVFKSVTAISCLEVGIAHRSFPTPAQPQSLLLDYLKVLSLWQNALEN